MTKHNEPIHTVTLVVTERCNMACEYCYVPSRPRDMTEETALRALDFLFESARGHSPVTVAFFGGEPLLVPELLETVCETALAKAGSRQRVIFSLTTNGTVLGRGARRLLERYRFQLAVSFDGTRGQAHRGFRAGGGSLSALRRNLPFFFQVGGRDLLARLTVTPENVRDLFENVLSAFDLGFRRISYLPAYERAWDESALRAWCRQLERLTTWMAGRRGAGLPAPKFPFWEGMLKVLAGTPPKHCGAGVEQLAVALDGTLYPCYRTVYDSKREALRLGHVETGIERPDVVRRLASLDPGKPRPQHGRCRSCPARGACGFFCPALGHLLAGDVVLVPEVACALEAVQASVLSQYFERASTRPGRTRLRWAAALAAAVLSGSAAACDRDTGGGTGQDAAVWEASVTEGGVDVGPGPGICPQPPPDAGPDVGPQPGACPVPPPDAEVDTGFQPGECPSPPPDSSVDSGLQPGLCPAPLPDAGVDSGLQPGLCPNPGP